MDSLTWAIISSFLLFWALDAIQMFRGKTTLSRVIGGWEHEHTVRHVIVEDRGVMLF